MNDSPDLSIILVSFNTCGVLRESLQSIERETGSLSIEVFVVDNNSRDGSVAKWSNSEFPSCPPDAAARSTSASAPPITLRSSRPPGRYIVLLKQRRLLVTRILCKPFGTSTWTLIPIRRPGRRPPGRSRPHAWQPSALQCFPRILSDLNRS